MDIMTYVQHKKISNKEVRLDSLKEYDFFRKSADGPIYRVFYKDGSKILTLNTRTLKTIRMEQTEMVVEVLVNDINIKIQIVDFI